jgi:hypothetical protein
MASLFDYINTSAVVDSRQGVGLQLGRWWVVTNPHHTDMLVYCNPWVSAALLLDRVHLRKRAVSFRGVWVSLLIATNEVGRVSKF